MKVCSKGFLNFNHNPNMTKIEQEILKWIIKHLVIWNILIFKIIILTVTQLCAVSKMCQLFEGFLILQVQRVYRQFLLDFEHPPLRVNLCFEILNIVLDIVFTIKDKWRDIYVWFWLVVVYIQMQTNCKWLEVGKLHMKRFQLNGEALQSHDIGDLTSLDTSPSLYVLSFLVGLVKKILGSGHV